VENADTERKQEQKLSFLFPSRPALGIFVVTKISNIRQFIRYFGMKIYGV